MSLPLRYNLRNVVVRWRSTLATILGIALVVAVYVLVQSLAIGLEKSAGNTGDPRNLLVVRKGALAESTSLITREQFQIVQYASHLAVGPDGRPLVSPDVLIVVNLPRANGVGQANALLRGTTAAGRALRPQVQLVAGRWPESGLREVAVSQRMAARFANLGIGESFRTGQHTFTVVGHFDGSRSAFDSEIWLDSDEARALFDRNSYSSLLLRPATEGDRAALIEFLENDKRLKVKAVSETEYYAEQTQAALPIKILGGILATMMSIGAVFAAMNTLYASVGARTREIGTLRVLGYRRRAVLAAFILEGVLLAAIGGALGCLLAFPMNGYSTGTISFETFAEVVFDFRITPGLVLQGMIFAVIVGFIGSLLPAIRAARLPMIAALKSV